MRPWAMCSPCRLGPVEAAPRLADRLLLRAHRDLRGERFLCAGRLGALRVRDADAGTDIEGHEIRLGYALSNHINLLARLYLVEAITTCQDGNRFRLDLNWRL